MVMDKESERCRESEVEEEIQEKEDRNRYGERQRQTDGQISRENKGNIDKEREGKRREKMERENRESERDTTKVFNRKGGREKE